MEAGTTQLVPASSAEDMQRVVGFGWRWVRGMTGGSSGNSGRPGWQGCSVGIRVWWRVPGGRRLQSVGCIIWEDGGKTDRRENLFKPEIVALNCNHRSLARFEEPELHVCYRVFSCNFKAFVCSILKTFVLHVLLWVLKK